MQWQLSQSQIKETFFMLLICTWKNRGWSKAAGKISLDDPIEKQLKL